MVKEWAEEPEAQEKMKRGIRKIGKLLLETKGRENFKKEVSMLQ